jgi:hypothetical protein
MVVLIKEDDASIRLLVGSLEDCDDFVFGPTRRVNGGPYL